MTDATRRPNQGRASSGEMGSMGRPGYGRVHRASVATRARLPTDHQQCVRMAVRRGLSVLPKTVGISLGPARHHFNVANGTADGTSDLFQAGAYLRIPKRRRVRAATWPMAGRTSPPNRNVTVLGGDSLRATSRPTRSRRLDGGYRVATAIGERHALRRRPGTTYASDRPTWSRVPSAAGTFALELYAGKDRHANRSEPACAARTRKAICR